MIGHNCKISPGVVMSDAVKIGNNCIIGPNTVLFDNVEMGDNVIIGANATIGHPLSGYYSDKGYQNPVTVISNNCIIRANSVIYCGVVMGEKVRTGHGIVIREHCLFGKESIIGTLVQIENNTKVGERVSIETGAHITAQAVIEDDVFIGPHAVTTNDNAMLRPIDVRKGMKTTLQGAHIQRGCRIGANVTFLPGLSIGRNCVVAAGSIVTKDIPDNVVVVGAPAKVVKETPFEFRL